MNYIELPTGVDKLENDDKGDFYFTYKQQRFLLKDVLAGAQNQQFRHRASGLILFVGNQCPDQNKLYAEYLPKTSSSCDWCVVQNGVEKNAVSRRIISRSSFAHSGHFHFLPEERKMAILDARDEQRDDRRTKGPKSV